MADSGVMLEAAGASNMDVKAASIDLRRGFVRKVYGILSVQLLLTVAIAAPLQRVDSMWLHNNMWLLVLSSFMTLAIICAMSCCCQGAARKFPVNYVLLFTFTAFEAITVGFVCATYQLRSVLLAGGITALIFLGLTAYACMTSRDFTGMGPFLFGALLSLCIFGLVLAILSVCGVHLKGLEIAYDLFGVLIFVFYIIFDTQRILGEWGGHKTQIGIDDYVFAALALFLDIVNLFLHILRLVGNRR